jgi:hypothetical protein
VLCASAIPRAGYLACYKRVAVIEEVRHFCRFLVFAVWPSKVPRKAYAIAEQPSKGMLLAI